MRRLFILAMAGAGLAAATPAAAAVTIVGPTATTSSCTAFSFSIADSACAGGYTGNLLQGTLQDPGLAALQAFGYTGTGTYLASIGSISGTTLDFGTMLTGMTLIGFHYGAAGSGTEATSFFLFNAGSGTQTITVSRTLLYSRLAAQFPNRRPGRSCSLGLQAWALRCGAVAGLCSLRSLNSADKSKSCGR